VLEEMREFGVGELIRETAPFGIVAAVARQSGQQPERPLGKTGVGGRAQRLASLEAEHHLDRGLADLGAVDAHGR
jgi:hypothetical protein